MKPLIDKLKTWAGSTKWKIAVLAMAALGVAAGLNVYFPDNAVSTALVDAFTQTPTVSPTTVQ